MGKCVRGLSYLNANNCLCKGILVLVQHTLGLVEGDVLYTQIVEDGVQSLTHMAKGHSAMVGIPLADEHMAVETAHLGDGEDADAAEGTGSHRQNLALCNIAVKHAVSTALQTEEGDLAGSDVCLQGAAGEVRLAAVLQQTVLDQLILDSAVVAQLADGGVTAVEAHEYVGGP